QLTPIDFSHPQSLTITNAPLATSDVNLEFTGSADFSAANEYVDVDINGVPIGSVFRATHDCANPPDTVSLVVTAAAFNAAVNGGDAIIHMVPPGSVDSATCPNSFIALTVTYLAPTADCDGNGILDECELAAHDCNHNGIVDACDIAGGTSQDCNN